MTFWVRLGAALLAAQAALLWSSGDTSAALAAAAKAALGTGLVFAVLDVAAALAGSGQASQCAGVGLPSDEGPTARVRALLAKVVQSVRPWHVLLLGVALQVVLVAGTPARLTVNVAGFLAFAGPLWWIVERGAGRRVATLAVGASAVFGVVALSADLPARRFVEDWGAASTYKWSAGWPAPEWRLAQTIQVPPALATPSGGHVLVLPLAQRYSGASHVLVTLNGVDAGAARFVHDRAGLAVDVSPGRIGTDGGLRVELRAVPPDPTLRVMALRWSGGATRGADASSFFDGTRWHAGTFNDAVGRAQPGVYVVRLEVAGSV